MENTTGLKLDVTVNTPTGHRMLQLRDEQPLKPQLRAFRALVFHHAVFFLLTRHCGGQPQMNKTNQTRDTHIHVPDDVFVTCHESNVHVLVIVAAGFLFIASIAVFIVVWKWRQNKSRRNKMKYFSETEPVQELEKKAEEPEGKVEVMEILMGQRNQQENLRDKLKSELKEVETEMTEKRKQLDNRNRWFLSNIFPDEVKTLLAETCQELVKRRAGLEELNRMLHRRDGWSFKPQLRAISALVFHHVVVFFLLTRHCG
ncbi:butyrophilin subfamily 3 member A2-like protein, partial [Lates japonicus]